LRHIPSLLSGGLIVCASVYPISAFSSNPQVGTPQADSLNSSSSSTVSFAKIPASAEEIVLSVETVKVSLKRVPGAKEMNVASNCPGHWNVSGNVIRQVAFSSTAKGVSIRADATGAQAMVNGKIYQLPRDSDGAVRSLKIESGQVVINGRKLDPIPGSDVPGPCTGPEVLEVQIPESYKGGLVLSSHGAADIQVDSWEGSKIVLLIHGTSSVEMGKVSGLSKLVIDIEGQGKARVKGVSTKALVANINGAGTLQVDGGSADMSNATVSGSGTITLKGKFKNLKKSVNGGGDIQVIE
jgi:hypothetical protein